MVIELTKKPAAISYISIFLPVAVSVKLLHNTIVARDPMQHEISVNSRTHNVIQCMNYMERTRKKDKHKKWVVLRERHRKYHCFG